jgi:cytidine deaminase
MEEVEYDRLSIIQQKLLRVAVMILDRAHCPYSNFAVGAALSTPDEKIFEGVNIENSAYGSTICAERSAVCHAVSRGEQEFVDLALVVRKNGYSTPEVAAPCGSCRQYLWEFASLFGHDLRITLATLNFEKIAVVQLSTLLPNAFGPRDMGFVRRGNQKST